MRIGLNPLTGNLEILGITEAEVQELIDTSIANVNINIDGGSASAIGISLITVDGGNA
jgi:hypothetical protein